MHQVYTKAKESKTQLEEGESYQRSSCCFDFRITIEADSRISLGKKINQRGSKDANSPHTEFMNERGDKLQTVMRIYQMCWRIQENSDKWCSPLEDFKA